MVSARKIRCVVVVAGSENDGMPSPPQPRFRPSDLLPWADPHIRSLVEQLQQEVREEQIALRAAAAQPATEPIAQPAHFAPPLAAQSRWSRVEDRMAADESLGA